MDFEQSAEEISERITAQGIKTATFKMQFKDVRLTRLKSKVFYIKKLSMNEQFRRKNFEKRGKNKNSHYETIKQLLMNIYISDSIIMAFTLRNIINQKALRAPLDRIKTQGPKHTALPYYLRELFKRKRYARMSQFFYRVSFQPKKKRNSEGEAYTSPRRRAMTTIIFAPSAPRKSFILRPALHLLKQTLPILLNSLHSNSSRELTLYSFRLLQQRTAQKKWAKSVYLTNLCRIINSRLQPSFCNIRAYAELNKKVIVPTLFNLEFKYSRLSADRIKQFNYEIEEFNNGKVAMARKFQRVSTQLKETMDATTQQIGQWETAIGNGELKIQLLVEEEERKKNRVQEDYFPLVKRLFTDYQNEEVKFFRRSIIIKRNRIQLNILNDWTEVLLSINIKLKKQANYYESQLCPSVTIEKALSIQYENLEIELRQLKVLVSSYIKQSYRYKILDNLKREVSKLHHQLRQIHNLKQKNDTQGLKKIFGMVK